MSEPKKTESFAGNVMKYSIATYLGFGISGAALIIKGVLPAESYAVPASFMAYTMSLMNVGMLGLDQSLLRFYHEPPAGSTGRSMFAACTRLSVLVMLLVGGIGSIFFAKPLAAAFGLGANGAGLVPFLFLTYLAMEYLEHKAGEKTTHMVRKAGKMGPLIGGVAGVLPQCGFSAAASNLYAGRVITLGTLIAIYLSTSDEMLPILISEKMDIRFVLGVLGAKAAIGAAAGFVIDLLVRERKMHPHDHVHGHGENDHEEEEHIHEICEHENCHCEEDGIFLSAVKHTLHITFFIIVIGFVLNTALHFVGEDVLAGLILNRPVLGPVLAGLVGLIPNCAASVTITQLYISGVISLGAMMSGLLVGAGVGLLVLFRVNPDKKENLKIVGILYVIGVLTGIVINWL